MTHAHPYLDKDHRKIRTLFDGIAPRYDLLNHLLSFNLDHRWRRQAIDVLRPRAGGHYLDVCCGTGDMAFELERRVGGGAHVVATDFSVPMLEGSVQKCRDRAGTSPTFLAGDTLRLPFADGTFDGVTVAFGIRNVENLTGAAREIARVLRPGGTLAVLEFTPVQRRWLRPLFHLYCHGVVPWVGNLVSRSRDRAYSYLQQSIDRWPTAPDFADQLRAAAFASVDWRILFPGNVALHWGVR
ncbi:MAG: bifunctional demethylmenaquinone methyltransferase/2-methoxy-6-polyprenyl-1,4-benzoquinol methylase UbiE [Planctomycetota bacterium]